MCHSKQMSTSVQWTTEVVTL